ncbi:MAG: Ig-like domain-containing protein [Ruminococcus sp.]|nr:Ig-like domain-containing protein [Ruminococcus sp.]
MKLRFLKRLVTTVLILTVLISSTALNANGADSVSIVLGVGETYTLPVKTDSEYTIGDTGVIGVSTKTVTALKAGVSTLSYKGTDSKMYTYSFKVNSAPSAIKLNCKSKTLYTNESLNLKYTLSAGSSGSVSFKSSNKKIASVSPDGRVFAKKKGNVTITASTYNGKTASCKIKIKQSVVRIDMSRQRIALPKKTKFKLKATVNSGAVSKSYKWKSSNKKVATVKGNGKSAVISTKKQGKAIITVKASNGTKQTCTVNVTSTKTTDSMEKQINSQPLYKEKTGFVALDKLVNKISKKIFKKGYSTYDKVKAIYDYEIKNFTYGHASLSTKQAKAAYSNSKNRLYTAYCDSDIADRAYASLLTNTGVCNDYAAVFVVMTRAIGLDTYSVGGLTTMAGGGWTGHEWNNMLVNGKYIVFDAQVEDNIANGGRINYYRFAKKENEVKNNYKYGGREAEIKAFKHFKAADDFSIKLTLTSGNKSSTKEYVWKYDVKRFLQGYIYWAHNFIDVDLGVYDDDIVNYSIEILKGSGAYYISGDSKNYKTDTVYCIDKFEGSLKAYELYELLEISDADSGCAFEFR